MRLEEACLECYEACFCILPKHEDSNSPHVCECGGSWEIFNGKVIPLVLPLGGAIPIDQVRLMKEQASRLVEATAEEVWSRGERTSDGSL